MANKRDSNRPFWIATEGGPAIAMQRSSLMAWTGAEPPRVDGRVQITEDGTPAPGDYERACALEGPCGVIQVGGRDALVLAASTLATTWKSLPDGMVFLRVRHAESRQPSLPSMRTLSRITWQPPVAELVSHQGGWLLFDAAAPGWEIYDSCKVSISQGRYQVAWGEHPSTALSLSAVRLTRVGGTR
ncbi:Imm21 family immunity protein [Haliangium ochraceum]|uniref:Uncharacterized protein n=1 Tax=Haliangium ochraceum (strain DSM 14365 / JCM 11303 / SMP-2) TaxID=502025 RepID=D0LNY2_HALO1|nr:Imm21 family immunity protein [Haliangium ochraceum]ACY18808.1 hypothetical protein Hoch_6338 [Haliangium ochraceum DSM 14365]